MFGNIIHIVFGLFGFEIQCSETRDEKRVPRNKKRESCSKKEEGDKMRELGNEQ